METWFISDTHFHHRKVIEYCNRPFADVEEMNETMIERWNDRVGKSDRVWHLGDFGLGRKELLQKTLHRLKGQKILVRGNHDFKAGDRIQGWQDIVDLKEIKIDDRWLFACHYPMISWSKSYHGSIQLHGHTHGSVPPAHNRIDVGVDCWDFRPINLDEILAALPAKTEEVA